jgi:hypothetical protein
MSNEDDSNTPTKASIINYVENFIEKHDNELRTAAGGADNDAQSTRGVNRDSIFIKRGENDYQHESLVSIENFPCRNRLS